MNSRKKEKLSFCFLSASILPLQFRSSTQFTFFFFCFLSSTHLSDFLTLGPPFLFLLVLCFTSTTRCRKPFRFIVSPLIPLPKKANKRTKQTTTTKKKNALEKEGKQIFYLESAFFSFLHLPLVTFSFRCAPSHALLLVLVAITISEPFFYQKLRLPPSTNFYKQFTQTTRQTKRQEKKRGK